MAVERAKVLAAIKTVLKGKSLSKDFKENISAAWAAKIDTDEDIEKYINDREDVLFEASNEADRRTTQALKEKSLGSEPVAGSEQKEPKIKVSDDTPKWAKALIEQNQKLEQRFTALQTAKTQESLAERFKNDERLQGMPVELLHGRYPTKEEDFESAVEATATTLKPFIEKLGTSRFGNDAPPSAGKRLPSDGKVQEATKEQLDALMANI